MLLKNALVYRNRYRDFVTTDIKICNGIISDIGNFQDEDGMDLKGYAIVPGLIDVHTHGRAGFDFVTAYESDLPIIARDYAKHGVTTVMPTLASAPFEELVAHTNNINNFVPEKNQADFCGVHLEGRYLSTKRKGAHLEELIAPLNADELENEVFRSCKSLQITAAYELDNDGSFLAKVMEIGGTASLGHTDATFEQAREAEKKGIVAYTHLFNAMPALHHRSGGAVCAALTGSCYAEIICDGIHVSPEMVSLAYSLLGCDRTVLISDSMQATGCPDGEYSIAGSVAVVKNGVALTLDGALAGSTLTLDNAVNNLIDFCSIPLTDAILCATENPARQVGVFDSRGSIEIGKRADLLIIDSTDRLRLIKVMVKGNFID
ncbi:MAG: N-acetylglucosamine-6-phosphate deacetylase [Clostridia bacterium]|nr:N-acetylglucosamine-6-phosphate deacetylase [Clostridia bacterium]